MTVLLLIIYGAEVIGYEKLLGHAWIVKVLTCVGRRLPARVTTQGGGRCAAGRAITIMARQRAQTAINIERKRSLTYLPLFLINVWASSMHPGFLEKRIE